MPSSGYAAIVFVASEQPTTAKWNLIGSNDSAFNLGTGLEDNVIINRHINAGSVTPPKLDFSTIGIITSSTTTASFTGNLDVDTLSYAIPAGCTKVYIIGTVRLQSQDATTKDITCWIDYNAAALVTKTATETATGAFQGASVSLVDTLVVAGGTTKNFKLRANSSAGNSTVGNRTVFIIPAYA